MDEATRRDRKLLLKCSSRNGASNAAAALITNGGVPLMTDPNAIKHNHRFQDLTGQRFGRLLVLEYFDIQSTKPRWKCQCDCGEIVFVISQNLKRGAQVSCGCKRSDNGKERATHRMCQTAEYYAWIHAKSRCFNPKDRDFENYGARGIIMCKEWDESFEAFYAYVGPIPNHSYSLDRIDNDGNYEPGNVRWATKWEQKNNRRPRRWKVKPKV